jgi:hypothetical protein
MGTKYFLLLAVTLLVSRLAIGQTSTTNPYTPGWGTLNYAVPESPAFKLLGTDPSNILRPTSIRTAALSLGNYLLDSGSVIPKNLAVEFSPFSFGNLSLHDYNENATKRFWYRTRFSAGTVVGSKGSYSMAEGVRLTLWDKTDLAMRPELNQLLMQMAITQAGCRDDALTQYIQQNHADRGTVIQQLNNNDSAVVKAITILEAQIQKEKYQSGLDSLTKLRETIANTLWNQPIVQLGLAVSEQSKDSLVKNASVNKVALYATAGLPLGKNGQLLIGVSDQATDSVASWYNNLSIGGRAYLGENSVKGYAELQFTDVHNNSSWYGALGVEFSIGAGIWGNFTAGLNQAANGQLVFVPSFRISYGTLASKKTITK